eukprot:6194001-Ditylum_brightwellii.AAC.1
MKHEKSPNELLDEEIKANCNKFHHEWKKDIKEGKVQSNCPISPTLGSIISNVNKIYEGRDMLKDYNTPPIKLIDDEDS